MTNGNDSVNFVPHKLDGQGSPISYGAEGLTKREYFAVMAFQGFLANSTYSSNQKINATMLVQSAVGAADILIKELNKGE